MAAGTTIPTAITGAGPKVPRSIDFVTSLPRTATGKLQKHKIRAQLLPTPTGVMPSR